MNYPKRTFNTQQEHEQYIYAIDVVREEKKASPSLLQRKLRIGYQVAAHILDMMEEDGIISAYSGAKPREVLN